MNADITVRDPDPFWIGRVISINGSSDDPEGLVRVTWFARIDGKEKKTKSIGASTWGQAWSKKERAQSTGWISNASVDKVVDKELLFTDKYRIRKPFLCSFYRGLDDNIKTSSIKMTAPPQKLFWWDEYQGILAKLQQQDATASKQWISDASSDSSNESSCFIDAS